MLTNPESIIDLLTADHREVERMFIEFEGNPTPELAAKIHDELKLHMEVEEQIFYPEVGKYFSEDVEHAKEEHAKAEELADKVRDDHTDHETFAELKAAISHHVHEEEAEQTGMFDEAKNKIAEHELHGMAERAKQLKADAAEESDSATEEE